MPGVSASPLVIRVGSAVYNVNVMQDLPCILDALVERNLLQPLTGPSMIGCDPMPKPTTLDYLHEETFAAAKAAVGNSLGIGELSKILKNSDCKDLYTRLQDLNRARRCAAHPDVCLPMDVKRALLASSANHAHGLDVEHSQDAESHCHWLMSEGFWDKVDSAIHMYEFERPPPPRVFSTALNVADSSDNPIYGHAFGSDGPFELSGVWTPMATAATCLQCTAGDSSSTHADAIVEMDIMKGSSTDVANKASDELEENVKCIVKVSSGSDVGAASVASVDAFDPWHAAATEKKCKTPSASSDVPCSVWNLYNQARGGHNVSSDRAAGSASQRVAWADITETIDPIRVGRSEASQASVVSSDSMGDGALTV